MTVSGDGDHYGRGYGGGDGPGDVVGEASSNGGGES